MLKMKSIMYNLNFDTSCKVYFEYLFRKPHFMVLIESTPDIFIQILIYFYFFFWKMRWTALLIRGQISTYKVPNTVRKIVQAKIIISKSKRIFHKCVDCNVTIARTKQHKPPPNSLIKILMLLRKGSSETNRSRPAIFLTTEEQSVSTTKTSNSLSLAKGRPSRLARHLAVIH